MYKKLLVACMALSAFVALAIPAIASAKPEVTFPTGTRLAVTHSEPKTVEATNEGDLLMTDIFGNVLTRCNHATMSGDLETNTGTVIEGTITTASFKGDASPEGECTGSFGNVTVTANPATNGLPWCLRATNLMNADEFQLRGGGCTSNERAIRFILHSTTVGECTYERASGSPVIGSYKTHPSAAQATITKQEFKRIAGTGFCPSVGYLDMTFNLTREGSPLYID